MLIKFLEKIGIKQIEGDPPLIKKEEEKNKEEIMNELLPNGSITVDTGEDILVFWPDQMAEVAKNGTKNGYMHVGVHKAWGCWGALIIYNLDRYKALCCSICGLRIKTPVDITTAEELKEFLEKDKNE